MASSVGKTHAVPGSISGNTANSAAKPPSSSSLPPAKRSRKAINCQPCRSSKLKCDRARPCSSCVLRGTTALCYPDGPPEVDTANASEHTRTDPQTEIQKIRHSLYLLESVLLNKHIANKQPSENSAESLRQSSSEPSTSTSPRYPILSSSPAAFDAQTGAGLYAGPTSSASPFFNLKQSGSLKYDSSTDIDVYSQGITFSMVQDEEDEELLNRLPPYPIVDRVLQFYASNCTIMNLFVQKTPLLYSWESYKSGEARTRLTLSLIFVIIAVTVQFLQPRDELFIYLRREHIGSIAELSDWFYEQSCQALGLHENVCTMPSLELVEVYLVQINYLSISKNHAEEVWRLRGIVASSAIALGLHRDPNKWNMPHPVAERRRWAWFNVLRVERWLAFMLGRPTVFNNNQFDCLFPSTADPGSQESSEVMDHQPFIHMFRLMILYGDMLNDLTSVKPVSYDAIMAHDRALENWMNNFPPSLRLDTAQLTQSCKSNDPVKRDRGVQTICLRLAGFHTRLALHRPFATKPSTESAQSVDDDPLRIAADSAVAILQFVSAVRQSYLMNPVLTVPGHIHWGVLHHFAAMIFLTFQVISRPDQSNTKSLQTLICNSLIDLEALRGIPAADKAMTIIQALRPLYSLDAGERGGNMNEGKREYILKAAMRLPIPFVDSPGQRTQRVSKLISPVSISPVTHTQSIPLPVQPRYAADPSQTVQNLQMGMYDQSGPILPSQIPTNPRDDTYWSSAVGVETNDWARFMQEVLPKSEYATRR